MFAKWLPGRPGNRHDSALAARMAVGDVAALGEIYDRHAAHAFALCLHLHKDSTAAEHALTAAFEALWRGRATLRVPQAGLRDCRARLVLHHMRGSKNANGSAGARGLESVLRTPLIRERTAPPPDFEAENAALHAIASKLLDDSQATLDVLVERAVALCHAGSAGVSVLERHPDGRDVFRWVAVAGQYSQHLGGSAPADFSPCGTTIGLGSPQLFIYPERYFAYFREARPVIVEGLVVPLRAGDIVATVWVVTHREEKQFHAEDARIMSSLAGFAAAAMTAQKTRLAAQPQVASPCVTVNGTAGQ